MSKASLLSLFLISALAAVGAACGDSGGDGDAGNGGTGGGGTGGGDGDGDGDCTPDIAEPNLNCPENVTPLDGCYQNKGECCFRRSNTVRRMELAEAGATTGRLEYRINYSLPQNHPMTLGLEAIAATAQLRGEREEQSLLWAFEGPMDPATGEEMSGDGFTTIGQGVYNCDGTYSFYGDSAATDRVASATDPANTDPTRWEASKMPSTVDVSKTGTDRNYVKWADRSRGRRFTYSPYVATADFSLDWELISMGFNIIDFDTTEDENCFGSRAAGGTWNVTGDYIAYTPVLANNGDDISTISENFCQLMGFGIVAVTNEDPVQPQCDDARCEPGTMVDDDSDPATPDVPCPWLKLPDALCPLDPVTGELDEAEAAKWGCHMGDESNTEETVNCTQEAPTEVLDPDVMGEGTSEGQCCDPLGKSTTLPACNAWIIHNAFVAAAAEITDEPSNELQTSCLVSDM